MLNLNYKLNSNSEAMKVNLEGLQGECCSLPFQILIDSLSLPLLQSTISYRFQRYHLPSCLYHFSQYSVTKCIALWISLQFFNFKIWLYSFRSQELPWDTNFRSCKRFKIWWYNWVPKRYQRYEICWIEQRCNPALEIWYPCKLLPVNVQGL